MTQPTNSNVQNNNQNVSVNVSTPNSRGAGTVLMFLFFWPVLLMWWTVLLAAWMIWIPVCGVVTIFQHDFFANNWFYPWPAWLFGIR